MRHWPRRSTSSLSTFPRRGTATPSASRGCSIPNSPGICRQARTSVHSKDRLTHAYTEVEADDAGTLHFVFPDSIRPCAELPRSSRLQRALVDHLDAGGHWYNAMGWLTP